MGDREELQALRRLAELEAKAGTSAPAPQAQPPQQPFVPSGEKTSGWPGGIVGYDPKALGITPAENIAGHPLTRFAMGAASPFLGAAQFGSELLGDKTGTETLKRTEELKRRGQTAMGGGEFDAAGLAGTMVSPAYLKLAQLLKAPASVAGRIGQGAAVGAGAGAATPVTQGDDFLGSKAAQVGTGAALGAAIPAGIEGGRAVGRGVRNIKDLFTKKGAERILTRYQDELVGPENRQAVIDALKGSKQPVPGYEPTAAEVLSQVPAGSPLVAHQRITAATRGGPSAAFGQRAMDQKTALAQAMEERSAVNDPMRREALERTKQVGVSTQKLIRQMRGVVSQPGIRASDVVRKTFSETKDKIKEFTKDGFIDADDLYTIRKKIGTTVGVFSRETANWDKKQTAKLERQIQLYIDDAIESAGGKGWGDYLKTYASGLKGVDLHKTREREAKLIAAGIKASHLGELAAGELPHPPTLLSRPMMFANYLSRMIAGDANTPVAKYMAEQMRDPQAYLKLLQAAPEKAGTLSDAARRAALAAAINQGQQP